jgi:hypothetical protein
MGAAKSTIQTTFLSTGDVLLVCLPKMTSFGHAPPDLVRGLMAAQLGTLATDDPKVYCKTWTHVAMVYRIPRDREEQARLGDRTKDQDKNHKRSDPMVMYADGKGLYVKSAAEFVRDMVRCGGTVVCRPLSASTPKKDWLGSVDHFYTTISPSGVSWKNFSRQQDPLVRELLEHVLCDVRKMPATTMLQLKQYFGELSDDKGEYIEGQHLRQMLGKIHDAKTARDLTKRILTTMDLSHDDLISFPEFLAAFSHAPFQKLSEQADAVGSCSAQLVCMLFETMGMVAPAMPGERSVLPEYFAKHREKSDYGSIKLQNGSSLGTHHLVETTSE